MLEARKEAVDVYRIDGDGGQRGCTVCPGIDLKAECSITIS